ncbi:Copia protein [Cyphomyrmex costatus]|uniref:Copia protein n=1 Tax=Cyphomyrmex costatus TaxID=456900 RepID=A0A151IK55_9HYME|nr:Copia protein [Cyphomyrmex costatus]
MDLNVKLSKIESVKEKTDMDRFPYQEAIGSLLYVAQISRPDINYAVNACSRYNNNPGQSHWNAVKRIFHYLQGTKGVKLIFQESKNYEITGYCDSDWGNDPDDRRSVTDYVFKAFGNLVSWNIKRQPTVALSTCEAEYMSLSAAVQEALWLKSLHEELNPDTCSEAKIYNDNKSAIDLSINYCYRARSKHIDIRHHFVREQVFKGNVILNYTETEHMVADFLTKPVATQTAQDVLRTSVSCPFLVGMSMDLYKLSIGYTFMDALRISLNGQICISICCSQCGFRRI